MTAKGARTLASAKWVPGARAIYGYYFRTVEDLAQRFSCSPDCLGPQHIREYQAELFQKRKLSPGIVAARLAALRFFYSKTLKKAWSIAETPYPKKTRRLPTILSQEEVAQLIDAATSTAFHRTLLRPVPPLVRYSLRHTFLTQLGESGRDAWTLARIAGHSTMRVRRRYLSRFSFTRDFTILATNASGSGLSFGNCTAPLDHLYGPNCFLNAAIPEDVG